MTITQELVARVAQAVQHERVLDTAVKLVEVPSPTCSGKAVADRLADILTQDGFEVERPEGGWPEAPAVAVRFDTGTPGKTIQFNGHLDTVHLPFVPPRVANGKLYGSGAIDMKGGVATTVEALRALRDSGALPRGSVLLTAHDLHESPWGDGHQLDELIDAGYVGDGVLLPEYAPDALMVAGRGLAIVEVDVTRDGEPVHEVLGGIDQPSVITAGAEVIRRFAALDRELAELRHPIAGRESIFVGRIQAGEIFNQAPTKLELAGTRRWLPGRAREEVEREFRKILTDVSAQTGTHADGRFIFVRDSFALDQDHPLVAAFQSVCKTVMGNELPIGAKPFVDDGNTFASRAGVACITHGPRGKGAHTLYEEVPIDELVRVANVLALTAIAFCGQA